MALAAILTGFAVMGLSLLLERPPLAHDEAVYALRGRYYAGEGSALSYWMPYRAPGLPLLLRMAWPLGETDAYLRAVVLAISMCGIVVTWAWTRRFFGVHAALFSAALLAITPTYLFVGSFVYVDIPSAVFGTTAVLVFVITLARAERSGTRLPWWVLVSIPVAALATLCRYGAPLLVGPAMAIAALAYWRTVRRLLWQVAGVAVAMLAALLAILLVPEVTGAAEPPLVAFRELTEPQWTSWWAPYGDLVGLLPDVFGPVAGPVAVLGVAAVLAAAARRDSPRREVFIALATVASFVVFLNLNLPFLVQNYLVPALPFAAMAAGAGLGSLTRRLSRTAMSAVLAAMLVLGWWRAVPGAEDNLQAQIRRSSTLREAAQQLRGQFGPDCVVWTSYVIVGWYSGCTMISFHGAVEGVPPDSYVDEMLFRTAFALDEGVTCDAALLVLLVDGGNRQPPGERLDLVREFMGEPIIESRDPRREGAYRFSAGLAGRLDEVMGDPRCAAR